MTESLTMTVPEAGELLGLGRDAAYEAVKRGDLPVLRFGRRLLVPRAALEKMLERVETQAESQISRHRLHAAHGT